MAKVKAGDEILIVNVDGIMAGKAAWNNGDVVEVVRTEVSGTIRANTTKENTDFREENGNPTFLITHNEHCAARKLSKVTQDNVKVGDKVYIYDLANIRYGDIAWDNGDIAEVMAVTSNYISITVTKPRANSFTSVAGKQVYSVLLDEFASIRKVRKIKGVK